MDEDVELTVTIPREYRDQLEQIARLTKLSLSEVVTHAFAEYFLELDESDIEEICEAVAEADTETDWVDHEEVRAWVRSLGTEHELPSPR